jgi:hypothetical protein
LAPSPNTLRRTRRRGMKIGLPKIANSLCSNNLNFVHLALRKKSFSAIGECV